MDGTPRGTGSLLRSTLLALALAAPSARAEIGPLRLRPKWSATTAGAAAVLALALASPYAAPGRCRICGSGEFDDAVRERLVWRDTAAARRASDVIASALIPAGVLLNSALSSWAGGDPSAFWADGLVLLEVGLLAADLNGLSKDAVARRRPYASELATGSGTRSFYSGHTSFAFSLAVGAGTLSTLRGYPSAPWVWASGMVLASGVAYLRVAGDAHWATDVIAGAAIGGLVGFAVPWFFHRVPRNRLRGLEVVPSPGGLAFLF